MNIFDELVSHTVLSVHVGDANVNSVESNGRLVNSGSTSGNHIHLPRGELECVQVPAQSAQRIGQTINVKLLRAQCND